MRRSWRRAVVLAAAVPLVLILCALLYQEGMARLEGQPRSFWAALGFVSETLTSTGYGADARWSTPAMVLFVVFLQFLGACLLALLISVYLIPSLEARFEQKLPRRRPSGLAEPVVVFRYGAAVESLIEQLEGARRSFLVVESDEQLARRLLERGVPVVFARDDDDAMEAAGLPVATALVANGRDEENVAAILRARQLGFGGSILALAEDPVRRRPMELAGASGVFTPKHMLAAALAARASGQISPRLSGIQEIGDLELREVRVELGSALAGQTLLELEERLSLQTKVIGVWLGGRLLAPPPPSTRLQAHCGLIVIGRHDPLERLTSLAEGAHPLSREGRS